MNVKKNQLEHETSLYLLQHKDNPVNWRPWSQDALTIAKKENKPIMLSIGYSACHWCHVMAHESFEDAITAKIINDHFIPIKVDREERPDLDHIYQTALSVLGQQGGWPLTMFLTPDSEPFWGGTYFPPEPRYGMPAFKEVLSKIAEAYSSKNDLIHQNTNSIKIELEKIFSPEATNPIGKDEFVAITEKIMEFLDHRNGGLSGAPKFPHFPLLGLLLNVWKTGKNKKYLDIVLLTIKKICQGGIYDHLDGGMARYSTDDQWLVPHFEKMLYDNAQFLELTCYAWCETKDMIFKKRIYETVDWLKREMLTEQAFASAIDADSSDGEGVFYLWTENEINKIAGSGADYFKKIYDVQKEGNWEGKNILNRLNFPDFLGEADEEKLGQVKKSLWMQREKRLKPTCDKKILIDWNGLMISSLAKTGMILGESEFIDMAEAAFNKILEITGSNLDLYHSIQNGERKHPATLDDYACFMKAGISLHEATKKKKYLDTVLQLVKKIDQFFWDSASGGCFYTSKDTKDVLIRTKYSTDNPNPSGNSIMCEVFSKLYLLTQNDDYLKKIEKTFQIFAKNISNNPIYHAGMLNSLVLHNNQLQIVIFSDKKNKETDDLLQKIYKLTASNVSVVFAKDGTALTKDHPAFGKKAEGKNFTAYICTQKSCLPPITKVSELDQYIHT